LGGGEDDHVEDVIDEPYLGQPVAWKEREGSSAPKSQNATTTLMSGRRNMASMRAAYMAHDEDGEPGIGRRPEEDGERLVIAASRRCNLRSCRDALLDGFTMRCDDGQEAKGPRSTRAVGDGSGVSRLDKTTSRDACDHHFSHVMPQRHLFKTHQVVKQHPFP
jgi:hypothetical protein